MRVLVEVEFEYNPEWYLKDTTTDEIVETEIDIDASAFLDACTIIKAKGEFK